MIPARSVRDRRRSSTTSGIVYWVPRFRGDDRSASRCRPRPKFAMTARTKIAIVGAGLMGHGIAEVFAVAGHDVAVYDTDPASLASLQERVGAILADMGEDDAALSRVTPSADLATAVADADVVIEAAPERLPREAGDLRRARAPRAAVALLASNTSVIPIGRIAAGLTTRDRVLGTHWWNPPYLVPLVEVIRTEATVTNGDRQHDRAPRDRSAKRRSG